MLSMSTSKILPWFFPLQIFSTNFSTISKTLFNNAKESKVQDLISSQVCTSFGINLSKILSMRYGDTVQNILYLSSRKMIIQKVIPSIARIIMIFEVSHRIQWVLRKKGRDGAKNKQIVSESVSMLISSLPKQY